MFLAGPPSQEDSFVSALVHLSATSKLLFILLSLTNNSKILKQKFREKNAFLFHCLLLPPSPFLPSLIFLSILKASVGHRDQGISVFGAEQPLWHVVGQVWTPTPDVAFVGSSGPTPQRCFPWGVGLVYTSSLTSCQSKHSQHSCSSDLPQDFDWLGIIFLWGEDLVLAGWIFFPILF